MKKKQRTTPFDLLFPDTPKIKIRRILLDNREEAAGPLIKCQEVKTSSTLPPPLLHSARYENGSPTVAFFCVHKMHVAVQIEETKNNDNCQ